MSNIAWISALLLALAVMIGSFTVLERRLISAVRAGKMLLDELAYKKIPSWYTKEHNNLKKADWMQRIISLRQHRHSASKKYLSCGISQNTDGKLTLAHILARRAE
jgi:hypothetical protein